MTDKILIIDDESDIRNLLAEILAEEGYSVFQAAHSMQAEHVIKKENAAFDLVILDIWLESSEKDGIEILKDLRSKHPEIAVLMISGHGSIDTAVQTIKLGAYDFIEKPFKTERLLLTIKRAIESARLKKENKALKQEKQPGHTQQDLIGNSHAIEQVRKMVEKVSQTDSRILISGQAGTGKGIVARLIHENSKRVGFPFIVLDCAMLGGEQLEKELFGDGSKNHIGLIEQVNGGTLFVDEISEMPLSTQAKLLRVLQDRKYKPVAKDTDIEIDIRVISSSSEDLPSLIAEGKFREDLYYRLNVVPMHMPSLHERQEDIPELCDQITRQLSAVEKLPPLKLGQDVLMLFQHYKWPGNIRELRNIIEWLMIMLPDKRQNEVKLGDLPEDVRIRLEDKLPNTHVLSNDNEKELMPFDLSLKDARESFEKQYLKHQIERFQGNISKTAKFIGMERTALHRKLKSLELSYSEDKISEESSG